MLSISRHTLYKWIKAGLIKAVALPSTGRRRPLRIPESEVRRIIEGRQG